MIHRLYQKARKFSRQNRTVLPAFIVLIAIAASFAPFLMQKVDSRMSPEVKFTDASTKGLSIVPASGASSPPPRVDISNCQVAWLLYLGICIPNPTPACPAGTTGTYPNCVTPACPAGTTGTYPNCVTPACPAGTIGIYPHCVAPACPAGTTGTYPNCVTSCTGPTCCTGASCSSYVCPSGYTGSPPTCCPVGSTCNGGGWYAPVGYLDNLSCNTNGIYGWTYVPQYPSTAITAVLYIDSNPIYATANLHRADLASIGYNHGFQFTLPAQFFDGVHHTISAAGSYNGVTTPLTNDGTGALGGVTCCTPMNICKADGNLYSKDSSCNVSTSPVENCTYGCTGSICKPPPAPKVKSFTVKPILVKNGATSTAAWEVLNVTQCTVSGSNGDGPWTGATGSHSTGAINSQTIYTLSCSIIPGAKNEDGTDAQPVSQSVTINIVPMYKGE